MEKQIKTMWKDRRGFLPRTWVVSFLIFTAVFALLFVASQGFLTDYDAGGYIDSGYNESYNKFSEAMGDDSSGESFRDIQEGITDKTLLEQVLDGTVFKAFIRTVKVTFAGLGIFDDITEDFTEDFGIPQQVAMIIFPLLSAIVLVILIFAVISAINRGNRV